MITNETAIFQCSNDENQSSYRSWSGLINVNSTICNLQSLNMTVKKPTAIIEFKATDFGRALE